MEGTFRASMNWFHTWTGVVLGGVLFAIFWMGTLTVFDREIDRWMAPMTRLEMPQGPVSLEALRPSYDSAVAAKATMWLVTLPVEREPVTRINWRGPSGVVVELRHPTTGATLPDSGTWAGTRFLYPFHYMLHIRIQDMGYWIVGLAGMAMMTLCASGLITHRKILSDFFTLRPDKKPRRLLLDVHNLTGVLGLPFHFLISLSGLVIFWSIYFPSSFNVAYGSWQAFSNETIDNFNRGKSNEPGETASFDSMIAESQRLWDGQAPRYVFVNHPGDAAGYVQIGRASDASVGSTEDAVYFDAASGRLLYQRVGSQPIMTAQRFISGLHKIQFRHWTLRWLYFGLGLVGCAVIASGYLFWLESRRKRHANLGLKGVRIVEGLTTGSVAGIVVATFSFFVVNRLLPLETTLLGQTRAALEVWTFYLVWLATFALAWLRPGGAWVDQCRAIAAFAVAAVLLNWITTGDHLIRSLSHRHLWPIAGMDLFLFGGALLAVLTARRLQRRATGVPRRGPARATGSRAAEE